MKRTRHADFRKTQNLGHFAALFSHLAVSDVVKVTDSAINMTFRFAF